MTNSVKISIHTPTKGATRLHLCLLLLFQYFNPHSHEGSDVSSISAVVNVNDFNPHSHEGSDVLYQFLIFCKKGFQSTLPRRERQILLYFLIKLSLISIHTPTKGATYSSLSWHSRFIFQSTLPRRERHSCT